MNPNRNATGTPTLRPVDIDKRIFDLYDEYCHGFIDRREFLRRCGAISVAGISGLVMAQTLLPRYAEAQTNSFTDERIAPSYETCPSDGGGGGTANQLAVRMGDELAAGVPFYGAAPARHGSTSNRPSSPRNAPSPSFVNI